MAKKHFKLASFSFICLFLLGIWLRFFALDKVPLGLSWDEASIGYNAWSILKTGRGEWGEFLPLHFRAFGEWKLPAYIYFDIPFIVWLGLNRLAVRLPAILSGIGGAIFFGFIWKKLKGTKIAFWAGLLFIFSFWSFSLSRGAFEANLGLLLFLGGWCLFLYRKICPSLFLFIITLYAYNAFRIITPLFVVWLLFLYRQDFKKSKVCQAVLLLIGGSLPLIRFIVLNKAALSRFQQVAPEGNRLRVFLRNYLSHFGVDFLLVSGDMNQRHFSQFTGQISLLVFALGLLGLVLLLRKIKKNKLQAKNELALLGLLLIAPLPAAITKESPHSLRAIALLPCFLSLACLGLDYLLARWKRLKSMAGRLAICLILIIFAGQYWLFYDDYFADYPQRSFEAWQTGYEALFEQLGKFDKQTPVYLSTKKFQPYIFDLFYRPRLMNGLDHDVAEPKFWHKSRLSRIENIYFVDIEEIIGYVGESKRGIYVVDASEEIFSPRDLDQDSGQDPGAFIPPGLDENIVAVNGQPAFYIFEI